jgi:hypothetical protein
MSLPTGTVGARAAGWKRASGKLVRRCARKSIVHDAQIGEDGCLHAKLYIGDGIVVVGSSNPSRYGLTQEGDVVGGSVEANLITDDPEVVTLVAALFEGLWDDENETVPVNIVMIRKEIDRRASDSSPPLRRRLAAKSLLAACREAPELFSSVVVCPYNRDLGKEGRKALRQLQRQASDEDVQSGVAGFRRSWDTSLRNHLPMAPGS